MNKLISKILATLLILTSLFAFVGCDVSVRIIKSNNQFALYTDSDPIENEVVKIEAQNPNCNEMGNYALSVWFNITNKEFETKKYTIKNIKLVKESTGAEYTVDVLFSNEIIIEAELNGSFRLSSKIPSSIEDDKYKLSLEINNYKIIYCFYETPDELRIDRKVNYYVSNQLVKSDIVKDKRKVKSLYIYETSDNLSYCSTWYTDESYNKYFSQFNASKPITSDINLYGYVESNFSWMTSITDAYSFLSGVNHVPLNGVLVLPQTIQGKKICIGNYAIKDISVNKICIPKSVHKIYGGNFTGIGDAIICYEGSKAEWESLFYFRSDAITKNVYFNTPYPRAK